MSFVKKDSNEVDLSVWEHLDSLNVTMYRGSPLNRRITDVVMDKEKECYLVLCGGTSPNFDDIQLYYYTFCVRNDVIRFEVTMNSKGNGVNNSLEFHWNIVKAEFPEGWSFDKMSLQEFKSIVTEAFITKSYLPLFSSSLICSKRSLEVRKFPCLASEINILR